jgi:hypothetical protein
MDGAKKIDPPPPGSDPPKEMRGLCRGGIKGDGRGIFFDALNLIPVKS